MVITEEGFFCVIFGMICHWDFNTWIYGVLLSAAVVLAENQQQLLHNEWNLRWNLPYSSQHLSVELF